METTRVEMFDHDAMRAILSHKGLSYETRTMLKAYYKHRFNGNQFRATYNLAKKYRKHGLGRLYVVNNLGIQAFERNVRNLLLAPFYWDVDQVNAHPTMLDQLCNKYGWAHPQLAEYVADRKGVMDRICEFYKDHGVVREDVKNLFIRMLYLGRKEAWMNDCFVKKELCLDYVKEFQNELDLISKNMWSHADFEKYRLCVIDVEKMRKADDNYVARAERIRNPDTHLRASFMSLVLQDLERKILNSADQYLQKQQRDMAILMYDGGLIRKLHNEKQFPADLLAGMSDYGFEQTGYRMKWSIKPVESDLDISKSIPNLIDASIVIDDDFAARAFFDIAKDLVVSSNKSFWVFNHEIGMWSNDKWALNRLVSLNTQNLCWNQYNDKGDLVSFNYGGKAKKINDMLQLFKPLIPVVENFIEENIETSLGKLLFSNGIYDFKADTFTEGFDHKIVFTERITRPFNRGTPEDIAKVNKVLFEDPFDDDTREDSEFLAKGVARGLYGDYNARWMYICRGSTASSKGTLMKALEKAFCGYIGTFNANSVAYKKNVNDEAKLYSWLATINNKRINISSEISMNQTVDSNQVKRIVSGGDNMLARKNFIDEYNLINRSTVLTMCNDVPKFEPVDSAILDRTKVIEMPCQFVENPVHPYERKSDPNIKHLFNEDRYKDAVVGLFIQYYQLFLKEGHKVPVRVIKETHEWVAQGDDWKDVFDRHFIVSKNEFDLIETKVVQSFFEREIRGVSIVKLGKYLSKLGIQRKKIKKGGCCMWSYSNIKFASEDDDDVIEPVPPAIAVEYDSDSDF